MMKIEKKKNKMHKSEKNKPKITCKPKDIQNLLHGKNGLKLKISKKSTVL